MLDYLLNKVFNFVKKDTLAQVFSCEFCEISKNTFFYRIVLVAASIDRRKNLLRRYSNTDVFLWILRNFPDQLFYRALPVAASVEYVYMKQYFWLQEVSDFHFWYLRITQLSFTCSYSKINGSTRTISKICSKLTKDTKTFWCLYCWIQRQI